MGTVAARTELELQQLKYGASGKVWVACLEVRRHGHEEGITLQGCSPSPAVRSSAEPVRCAVKAPASLGPPPVKRLASRCAKYERREVKGSTVSATKGWQRIERSNTMLQRAPGPERSSDQA